MRNLFVAIIVRFAEGPVEKLSLVTFGNLAKA